MSDDPRQAAGVTVGVVDEQRHPKTGARQAKVKRTGIGSVTWWVVSTVVAYDTGKLETLAFEGYEDGWGIGEAKAGGIGQHREDVLRTLASLDFFPSEGPVNVDEWVEAVGGPIRAVTSVLDAVLNPDNHRPYDDSDEI